MRCGIINVPQSVIDTRVQKNPFFKKPNPGGFWGFYRVFGFIGFFGRAVPAAVSKYGKGK